MHYGYSFDKGDFNGDGFADLLIAADYPERLFVYNGSASGLSVTPSWTTNGFGGRAGDFNGDGFDDLAVGIMISGNTSKISVSYGSASGLSVPLNWPVFYEESRLPGLGGVGDFNKDGFDDLVVSAPSATNPEGDEGKVWIHYGSTSGLSTTFSWTGESNQPLANYGETAAGDFNKDGFDDLAVGADGYNREGRVFIYYHIQ